MTLGESLKSVFANYANFKGRARRSEYWYFRLITFIIGIGFQFAYSFAEEGYRYRSDNSSIQMVGIVMVFYMLIIAIPSLSVLWRRLHDTGRSGFWALIELIPILGAIILMIICAADSQPGDNQYGPDPKAELHSYDDEDENQA